MCRDILQRIAERHRMRVISLAVSDDHIHLVVSLHPDLSPSKALRYLKGASSFALFRIVPNFRKRYPRGYFWGRNDTFRSVSDVDVRTVVSYSERHNQLALSSFA